MSVVRRNLLANIAGKGWTALVSLTSIPVFVHFLGIEAYGLIGIFLALYGILSLLDLGLGATLNRELARLSVEPDSGQGMRDLLRTLEIVYCLVGIVAGATVSALAPVIAAYWVQAQQLSPQSVERAFFTMGLAIACQWPLALYAGGLMGLQRQVALNAISAAMATVRNVGAVMVLWQVSATIEVFLVWHVAAALVETVITGVVLWRSLPAAKAAAGFNVDLLRNVWRFAAGLTGISAMAVVLTQLDKVILSNLLSLEMFGYYTLAGRVANGLYYLISPVVGALFPRFSQLYALGDERELSRLYHVGCQLMSVLILPVAVVVAFFSHEFLLLWTQDDSIARNSHVVLGLLMTGTALNAMVNLPYMMQLAAGWTRLMLQVNILAALLLGPLIYLMSLRYGAEGAAAVWVVLNLGYLVVVEGLMHRRLLRGELWQWWTSDVGRPLAATLAVAGAWKWLIPFPDSIALQFLNLLLVWLAAAAAATTAAPHIQTRVTQWFLTTSACVRRAR